jgi:hypothetical protein
MQKNPRFIFGLAIVRPSSLIIFYRYQYKGVLVRVFKEREYGGRYVHVSRSRKLISILPF